MLPSPTATARLSSTGVLRIEFTQEIMWAFDYEQLHRELAGESDQTDEKQERIERLTEFFEQMLSLRVEKSGSDTDD